MKRSLLLAVLLILAATPAVAAAAQAHPPKARPHADAPPPPGMDDPGVQTAVPPTDARTAPATRDANAPDDALAPLPKPDTRLVRDKASRDAANGDTAKRAAASDVAIHKEGGDTVEEYRQGGHVWMIRIVPEHGPVQTFMDTTGSGRLTRDPREGPISPVYYTLYEWN